MHCEERLCYALWQAASSQSLHNSLSRTQHHLLLKYNMIQSCWANECHHHNNNAKKIRSLLKLQSFFLLSLLWLHRCGETYFTIFGEMRISMYICDYYYDYYCVTSYLSMFSSICKIQCNHLKHLNYDKRSHCIFLLLWCIKCEETIKIHALEI